MFYDFKIFLCLNNSPNYELSVMFYLNNYYANNCCIFVTMKILKILLKLFLI